MRPCYVIFFMDGDISHVTEGSIEDYAAAHGYNIMWGRGDAGQLVRHDGWTPARNFTGTVIE